MPDTKDTALLSSRFRYARAAATSVLCTLVFTQLSCATKTQRTTESVTTASAPPTVPTATPTPAPTPTPDVTDKAHQSANEMGRIPILMYHSIGAPGRHDANGLNIPASRFREHMERLHKEGFYPVNLRDLLDPALPIPAGKTPVVITFDDARPTQFRYKPDGSIDPNCAVGILDAMHRKHGDEWPQRATFFVLPKGPRNPVPFMQEGREKQKLQYLVKSGYEIANHSTSHDAMSRMSHARLKWESENCRAYIQKLEPGATMDTFALPYGVFPKTRAGRETLAKAGNKFLMKAWGDASVPPWDKRFDRLDIDRIGSVPGYIESWITLLGKPTSASVCRYVSDGDGRTLSIPPSRKPFLVAARVPGMQVVMSREPFPLPKPKGAPPQPKRIAASAAANAQTRKE